MAQFAYIAMSKQNKQIVILVIVILSIASVGVTIFLIHGISDFKLKVRFSEAKGINGGSPVIYKGLKIGSVSKIEVNPDGKAAMVLKIDAGQKVFIRQNALFVINTGIFSGKSPQVLLGTA